MLNDLELNARTPLETPPRGVFCTRTLDMKTVKWCARRTSARPVACA